MDLDKLFDVKGVVVIPQGTEFSISSVTKLTVEKNNFRNDFTIMNKEKLYNDIRLMFESVSNDFGFIKPDFGAGYEKIKGPDIYSLHHSQIVTQGVMDNKFEIIPSADCTIIQVEGLWHDLYPLTISIPNENSMSEEEIEKFKKLYPTTYAVNYDKEKVKAKFPENIRDTGWLCFDISDKGFEQFKKVLRYI